MVRYWLICTSFRMRDDSPDRPGHVARNGARSIGAAMRMILFSSRQYDRDTFTEANASFHYELHFQESYLDSETAILAHGYEIVCPFVNDTVDAAVLEQLHAGGTQLIALRSAGFNHVD